MQDFIEEKATQSATQEVPGFNRFYEEHPQFHINTLEKVKYIWTLYNYVRKEKIKKIQADGQLYNKFLVCTYGVLMRQSLEFIIKNETTLMSYDSIEKTLDELLDELKQTGTYNGTTLNMLYNIKQFANRALHVSQFDNNYSAIEYQQAYENGYNSFLSQYISKHRKTKNIRYLKKLHKAFSDLTPKNKVIKALLSGLFIRFICESIAANMCFNRRIIEIKENGEELKLSEMLERISLYDEEKFQGEHVSSVITVNNLHVLRMSSNLALHYSINGDDLNKLNRRFDMDIQPSSLYCGGLNCVFEECFYVVKDEYGIFAEQKYMSNTHRDYYENNDFLHTARKKDKTKIVLLYIFGFPTTWTVALVGAFKNLIILEMLGVLSFIAVAIYVGILSTKWNSSNSFKKEYKRNTLSMLHTAGCLLEILSLFSGNDDDYYN